MLLLVLVIIISLTSCTIGPIADDNGEGGDSLGSPVEPGDINNIEVNISSSNQSEVLATSKALMSVVSVRAKVTYSSSGGFGGVTEGYSQGSGVIYKLSEDKGSAYILTNYHVVYGSSGISEDIKIYLYGQESQLYGDSALNYAIKATYLGGSMKYDLAILKVENSDILRAGNVRECDFADSNKIAILESAIAVGNANGRGISATMGRVNVDSEEITMPSVDNRKSVTIRVIRTDAAVNSGNSGGGLFNSKGELIGIVNAKSIETNVDNIGYAIPSNVAKYIADNIIYYCDGKTKTSVQKCSLGITVEIDKLYTEYDMETGILHKKEIIAVKSINTTSAARNVLKVGDIINHITIDGVEYEVTRMFHVVDSMLNARANSNIVINVTRGNEVLDLTVKVSSANIVDADRED